MKIIGAGFGRTGTTSLKAALEAPGFGPSYRLDEIFKHPAQVAFWQAARRGRRGAGGGPALAALGFGPRYRLGEIVRHPEQVAFWEAARRGERVDWEGFFAGYGVAVDWPAFSFYQELMEALPEAPVILTVRDPERWYESVRSTIYGLHKLSVGPAPVRLAYALAGLFAPGVTGIARLADRTPWAGRSAGRFVG